MKFDETVKQYLQESTYASRHPLPGNTGHKYTWEDGSYEYRNKDGELHWLDGPARYLVNYIERGNIITQWFVNGKRQTQSEVEELKKKIAIKQEIQVHKNNLIDPGMLEDYL